MTKHRRLILEIINASDGHMTAEEIFIRAKKMQHSIAVGTVYRNLGLMAAAGEIRRIVMPDSPDVYDKSTQAHGHIICQICHEMSDINISNLKDYLTEHTGCEILDYDLKLRYICKKCGGKRDRKTRVHNSKSL